jgi:ABC-type transport system involved in multi-copper enzyme maturation permease subunit
VISTIIILVFLFVVNVDSVEGMVDVMESTGEDAVKQLVIGFQIVMLNISYLLIITFCLISVSSFIPSMIEKGNIDLLLSKPISRANIILGKFSGGVILIFLSLVYLIGFVWLILSAKSGYWHIPFLYSIFWLTLSFAVVYSVVILLGLTTKSSILTIIITLFLVFVITPFLAVREETVFTLINNEVFKFIINFFYYVLPKPSDINTICANIILGEPIKSYQPLITSLLFMVTMLFVSILYFRKRDY